MTSLAVSIGAITVPLGAVWRSIGHPLGTIGVTGGSVQDQIVWDLRVPRGLLAFVVGPGLAVAGTVIQATVRNPLGDPYLLGIAPGAAAGAVLVLVAGSAAAAGLSLAGAAFVGAMIAFVATFVLSRQGGRWPPTRLILAGVAVGYLWRCCAAMPGTPYTRALVEAIPRLDGGRPGAWSTVTGAPMLEVRDLVVRYPRRRSAARRSRCSPSTVSRSRCTPVS